MRCDDNFQAYSILRVLIAAHRSWQPISLTSPLCSIMSVQNSSSQIVLIADLPLFAMMTRCSDKRRGYLDSEAHCWVRELLKRELAALRPPVVVRVVKWILDQSASPNVPHGTRRQGVRWTSRVELVRNIASKKDRQVAGCSGTMRPHRRRSGREPLQRRARARATGEVVPVRGRDEPLAGGARTKTRCTAGRAHSKRRRARRIGKPPYARARCARTAAAAIEGCRCCAGSGSEAG